MAKLSAGTGGYRHNHYNHYNQRFTDPRESIIGGLVYLPRYTSPLRQNLPLLRRIGGMEFWRYGRFFSTLDSNYNKYNDYRS